jgi:hypothetical protein
MAKNYFKKSLAISKMKPEKEIVSFLLHYSKAMSVIKTKNITFEIIAN